MSCLGFDGKAYYNTGTNASPTWVEITNVRDVTTSASADTAEISDRGSKFKKYCQGMIDLETTINMTYRVADASVAALRVHFLARTTVEVLFTDNDITAASSTIEGYRYFAHVTSQDFEQPLTDGQTIAMTFKPAWEDEGSGTAVDPSWFTVTNV